MTLFQCKLLKKFMNLMPETVTLIESMLFNKIGSDFFTEVADIFCYWADH